MSHFVETDTDEKVLNDEYKSWKKNCPFLYDFISTHALLWPSYSVQWLPNTDNNSNSADILLGTFKSANKTNYILKASFTIPDSYGVTLDSMPKDTRDDCEFGIFKNPTTGSLLNGFQNSQTKSRLKINEKFCHEGEVVRLRYMPQRPSIVASPTIFNDILIYATDKEKRPDSKSSSVSNSGDSQENDSDNHAATNPIVKEESDVGDDEVVYKNYSNPTSHSSPDLKLTGLLKSSTSLSWNSNRMGFLLACGQDQSICLWDLNEKPRSAGLIAMAKKYDSDTFSTNCGRLEAHSVYMNNQSMNQAVDWHSHHSSVFGSVCTDGNLSIWDVRSENRVPSSKVKAHAQSATSISFNKFSEFVFATGSVDHSVALWDLRNLRLKLHSLMCQNSSVFQIEWSPHFESVLAASGSDRKLFIWDLSLLTEKHNEEQFDGSSELLFVHGGHSGKICDFCWSPNDPWVICSVSNDNIVQFWKMSQSIIEDPYSCGNLSKN